MLRSRSLHPPGGWMIFYEDPAVKISFGGTFDEAVNAMWLFRRNNSGLGLSLDKSVIAQELDEWTCQRLKQDKRLCHPKTPGSDAVLARLALISPKSRTKSAPAAVQSSTTAKPKEGVAALVAGLRRDVNGLKLLGEWIGETDLPVPLKAAQLRGDTCIACQFNRREGGALDRMKGMVGSMVNRIVEVKTRLNLHLPNEKALGVCDVCECFLPTKIWVGFKKLRKDTLPEIEKAFPAHCWYVKEKAAYVNTFYHSGDLGDVIYGMPTMKALGGGVLRLGPDQGIDPVQRPRERMTAGKAALLRPLLELQPYVKSVEYSETAEGVDYNLNDFRPRMWEEWQKNEGVAVKTSLMHYQLMTFGLEKPDDKEPWLDPLKSPKIISMRWPIVIHRSPRYHNDLFPWKELVAEYGKRMIFVGIKSEHDAFCQEFGQVAWARVRNFADTARIISGAAVFIGNQSLPYSIAEGMKVPTIQETCLDHPNCIFPRANALFVGNGRVEPKFIKRYLSKLKGFVEPTDEALPVCMFQAKCNVEQTKKTVDFCRELDGTEVQVFTEEQDLTLGKAKLSNLGFRHVLNKMRGKAFIWLEADASPIQPYWAKLLSVEYALRNRPFLLSVDTNPPHDMIGGIGVYGESAAQIIPEGGTMPDTEWANWDGWLIDHVPHMIARSALVQHSYGVYTDGEVSEQHEFPRDIGMLRGDAVIFHKDQNQTLIT